MDLNDHLGMEPSFYRLMWREKWGYPKVWKNLSVGERYILENLEEEDVPSDLSGMELLTSFICLRV